MPGWRRDGPARPGPARKTLSAPTVSACALQPHDTLWNFSWASRLSVVVPAPGHRREVSGGQPALPVRRILQYTEDRKRSA